MKTKRIKGLSLGKNTIANLDAQLLGNLKGGGTYTCIIPSCTCPSTPTVCLTLCKTNCPECPPDPSAEC